MARSSSNSSAIRYLLPVLPMTLFSNNGPNRPESKSKTTRAYHPVHQVAAPGAKPAVSDYMLFTNVREWLEKQLFVFV